MDILASSFSLHVMPAYMGYITFLLPTLLFFLIYTTIWWQTLQKLPELTFLSELTDKKIEKDLKQKAMAVFWM